MGSSAFKTEPSLNVFAPTSKLVATETSPATVAEIGSPAKTLGQLGKASTGISNSVAVDPPSSMLKHKKVLGLLAGVISGLPSWAVSLVVHLALILTLAICTFGINEGDQILNLELGEVPADFESLSTEIEFEEIELEDATETLDEDLSESLQDQEMDVSLVMADDFAQDFQADLAPRQIVQVSTGGPVTGFPESSSESKGANFFGTKSYGSRFVFVIDCSLSMKGNRWYRAVRELNTAIDGLNSDQKFLVILYNEGTSVMMNADPDELAMVQASQDNRDLYRRWIRKQRPNGGTFPANAIFLALGLEPDAIFLLSDGELQDNTHRLLPFWNMPLMRDNGKESRVPVHTVSLGAAGQGQEMMETIAEQNEGKFKWIK